MKASHALISTGIISTTANATIWAVAYMVGCFIHLTFTPFEITESVRVGIVVSQFLTAVISICIVTESKVNLVKIYRDRYKK